MKEIRYQRSPSANKPSVWERELPRDWKDDGAGSPWPWWKEALGILAAAAGIISIPWVLAAFEIAFKK